MRLTAALLFGLPTYTPFSILVIYQLACDRFNLYSGTNDDNNLILHYLIDTSPD